jgi:transcriptional regulator with XRE-family HTH domain
LRAGPNIRAVARRIKPPIAEWIARERKRAGLSVDQLVERLALVGVNVGRQTVQVWESYADRRPKADTLDALERIFGSTAPALTGATETPDSLLAALAAQTAAISELVGVLREGAEDRESRLRTLEAVVSVLLRQDAEASPEQSVPRVTVE